MEEISISISSKSNDEYRIILSPFNQDIIPCEVRKSIRDIIGKVLNDNNNLILYFYCDDMHDIPRRDKALTPQKFRSLLFSRMFDKYISSNSIINIINTPIEIKADRHIYIHLISRACHLEHVNAIKSTIMEMESK